jgi:hypothetical protein
MVNREGGSAAPDQAPGLARGFSFGTVALLAIAGFLYVNMLLNIRSFEGGEAGLGVAIAWLFFTAGLWVALTLLLIVGAVIGEMPRGFAKAAIVLQPLAGAALFVGGDFYSRHSNLPIIEPALLPVLIAGYAVWARFPALHVKLPPAQTSWAVWGSVLALSVVSLLVAASY